MALIVVAIYCWTFAVFSRIIYNELKEKENGMELVIEQNRPEQSRT